MFLEAKLIFENYIQNLKIILEALVEVVGIEGFFQFYYWKQVQFSRPHQSTSHDSTLIPTCMINTYKYVGINM